VLRDRQGLDNREGRTKKRVVLIVRFALRGTLVLWDGQEKKEKFPEGGKPRSWLRGEGKADP